jgi:hypothetical protein
LSGVLSLTTLSAIGKRGRPTLRVEILARPGDAPRIVEACFRETPTIGLRRQPCTRHILARRALCATIADRVLDVKEVRRPDGPTAKAEIRAVEDIPGYAAREQLRRAAELRILSGNDHEDTGIG